MSKKSSESIPRIGPAPETTPSLGGLWNPEDYRPAITGSGALKLVDSGVAPLVAAARGYETVRPEQVKDFATRNNLGRANTIPYFQLEKAAGNHDTLIIPWYSASDITNSHRYGDVASWTSLQLRPAKPQSDPKTGKKRKYEFLSGHDTVLDFHPSTPMEWIDKSGIVLMTEGALKADSALTAQLIAAGVPAKKLRIPEKNPGKARAKLTELMLEAIDPADRVAILAFGGVTTWRANPEWRTINIKDRRVWVAFDGDTGTNRNVWNQANDLFDHVRSRHGQPFLVDLSQVELEPGEDKIGLDDYLTGHGGWGNLVELTTPNLPKRPTLTEEETIGQWRVNPVNGASVDELVAVKDATDNVVGTRWETRSPIGGQVLHTSRRRRPTDLEIKTGIFGEGYNKSNDDETECLIELTWMTGGEEGQIEKAQIKGPTPILNYPPAQWHSRGARIPSEVLCLEEWPPEKGTQWLKAVKANKADVRIERTIWETMDWVIPEAKDAIPAFIVGDQVLAATPEEERVTLRGITDEQLAGASHFGVIDVSADVHTARWRAEITEALNDVYEHMFQSGVWTNPDIASIVLAIALRPIAPIPNRVNGYLYGPPRKGKSWTAGKIMGFWNRIPGTWSGNHLPGSFKDTEAAMEHAISVAPIWVLDDLAPSSNRQQAQIEMQKADNVIRNKHNRAGKRRMNVDMSARSTFDPKAIVIITAENEPTVGSVRDRTIMMEFTDGALSDDETVSQVTDWAATSESPAKLTAAGIRAVQALAKEIGWAEVVSGFQDNEVVAREHAGKVLSEFGIPEAAQARHREMAADVTHGLTVLMAIIDICDDDDLKAKYAPIAENMVNAVARQVARSRKQQTSTSPGEILLDVISDLLQSGLAHLSNASDPSLPPVSDPDHIGKSALLGWRKDTNGDWRPIKPEGSIGWVQQQESGEYITYLAPAIAFKLASQHYPDRIQYGSSQKAGWASVWSEQLTAPGQRRDPSHNSVRLSLGDGAKKRGVPIMLDRLLNIGSDQGDDD